MHWLTGSLWADLGAMQSKAGAVEEQTDVPNRLLVLLAASQTSHGTQTHSITVAHLCHWMCSFLQKARFPRTVTHNALGSELI